MEILQQSVCALLMANLEVPDGHLKMHEALWIKKSSRKESWQFRLTPDRCSDQKVVVIKDFFGNFILRSQPLEVAICDLK